MLEELKEKVFKANLDLVKQGLVIFDGSLFCHTFFCWY